MDIISMGESGMDPMIKRPGGGVYISLEGIEGVGKTYYQSKLTAMSCMEDSSFTVTPSPEISLDGFGKEITDVLANHDDEFFRCGYPLSEAMVFFAMKLFELERTVVPALSANNLVLEDRSVDSNCVYAAVQLAERNRASSARTFYHHLLEIRSKLGFIPDYTILLLDDVEACIERATTRSARRLTYSECTFIKNIYDLYLQLPSLFPERIIAVNLSKVRLDERVLLLWETIERIHASCKLAEPKR